MQMHTPAHDDNEHLPQIEPNFMEYWNIILHFHFATRQRLIRPYASHILFGIFMHENGREKKLN